MSEKLTRCKALVYHRDCYRVARGSRHGFKMHYRKEQCTRRPGESGYCWQHERLKAEYPGYVSDCRWAR